MQVILQWKGLGHTGLFELDEIPVLNESLTVPYGSLRTGVKRMPLTMEGCTFTVEEIIEPEKAYDFTTVVLQQPE